MLAQSKTWLRKITPTQFIIIIYIMAIFIATFLLSMPFSLKPGVELNVIDALFTATSGVSVTGHTVVDTIDTFSFAGTLILIVLFHLGSIGIMTLGTFVWLIFGRNITLSYRKLIMIDQNRHNLSGLVKLMRIILLLALAIEAGGVIFFTTYFYLSGYYTTWSEALYYGFFHAISSYTNAGFDLFGQSLHQFANDYVVQLVTMLLIVLGAIGFPVLIELKHYFFGKEERFRFSLFTKLTMLTFAMLLVFGVATIWWMEKDLFYAHMPWHQKLFYSLFNAVTVRSGGMATMDVSQYNDATQFFLSINMFIGANPSSVGGGIRTTTFAVALLTIATFAIGRSEVRLFGRSIKQEDITKSLIVLAFSSCLIVGSVFLLSAFDGQHFSLMAIIFNAASAFGTCGLAIGQMADLSAGGKIVLMILMFIGRVGVLSLLFMFRSKKPSESYRLPTEDVIIG